MDIPSGERRYLIAPNRLSESSPQSPAVQSFYIMQLTKPEGLKGLPWSLLTKVPKRSPMAERVERHLFGEHLLRFSQKMMPGFQRIPAPDCDATDFALPIRLKLHVAIHVVNVLPNGIVRSVWVVLHDPRDETIDLLSVRIVPRPLCARVTVSRLRGTTLSASLRASVSCRLAVIFGAATTGGTGAELAPAALQGLGQAARAQLPQLRLNPGVDDSIDHSRLLHHRDMGALNSCNCCRSVAS